jgi:hypothetical protein
MEELVLTREEKYWKVHKIIDGILYRKCSKCKKWLPETDEYFFWTNKKKPEKGFQSECKVCGRKRSLKNRNDNIDRARASWRNWYRQDGNAERVKEYNREYYEADPQRKLQIAKEFRQKFPEIANGYTRNRKNKNHNINNKEWHDCKRFFDFKCAYCGRKEDENRELFGCQLHKEHAHYDGVNDLSNCVPACQECNSEKHIFALDDWYNSDNIKYTQIRYNRIQKWLQEDYKKYIILDKKPKRTYKRKST